MAVSERLTKIARGKPSEAYDQKINVTAMWDRIISLRSLHTLPVYTWPSLHSTLQVVRLESSCQSFSGCRQKRSAKGVRSLLSFWVTFWSLLLTPLSLFRHFSPFCRTPFAAGWLRDHYMLNWDAPHLHVPPETYTVVWVSHSLVNTNLGWSEFCSDHGLSFVSRSQKHGGRGRQTDNFKTNEFNVAVIAQNSWKTPRGNHLLPWKRQL